MARCRNLLAGDCGVTTTALPVRFLAGLCAGRIDCGAFHNLIFVVQSFAIGEGILLIRALCAAHAAGFVVHRSLRAGGRRLQRILARIIFIKLVSKGIFSLEGFRALFAAFAGLIVHGPLRTRRSAHETILVDSVLKNMIRPLHVERCVCRKCHLFFVLVRITGAVLVDSPLIDAVSGYGECICRERLRQINRHDCRLHCPFAAVGVKCDGDAVLSCGFPLQNLICRRTGLIITNVTGKFGSD